MLNIFEGYSFNFVYVKCVIYGYDILVQFLQGETHLYWELKKYYVVMKMLIYIFIA